MNRFIIALAVLAACDDGTDTDTDTTTPTGETGTTDECADVDPALINTQVITIDVGCNSSGEGLLEAALEGVSAPLSATMFLQETGNTTPQWSEEHPLDTKAADICLASETLEQVIENVDGGTADYVPGSGSVFDCAGHFTDPNVLTIAVYVEDADDPTSSDCLVVGHDPAGLINGDYDGADRAGVNPSFDLGNCIAGN